MSLDVTMRDYFAAKAAQGFVQFWGNSTEQEIARRSYALADAMLTERGISSSAEESNSPDGPWTPIRNNQVTKRYVR